ncbi:MAG: conjugal transfer protein TraX [Hungatella hathewayi]|nr:conjugal transfer protein TraX [Hungatella hathewayi]
MNKTISKGLNSNQLKLIAIIAMTIDHLTSVIFPGYPLNPGILLLHTIGRLTMPIMCFFIAEGYHYTHNVKHYASRLFLFAVISHFAYNFAFGIPFIPFQTTIFNQTSIIWSLAWGLVALAMFQCERPWLKPWMKSLALAIICVITFCSDWSCIAVLIIVYNGQYRGDFRKQMTHMLGCVAMYAAIYILFINPVYGLLQMTVALAIPLLRQYNGTRGKSKSMKWFFYLYYPLHLVLCGLLRIAIHGNIGVLIGGV